MRKSVLVIPVLAVVTLPLLLVTTVSKEKRERQPIRDIRNNAASHRVKAVLIDAFGPDALNIVVGVEDNVAVLSGDVRERPTRRLARQVAESVDGIIVAHNFLQWTDGSSNVTGTTDDAPHDETLRSRLSGKLDAAITVDACDGVVVLQGDLSDNRHRDAAVRIAESLSGVTKVIDLLHVAWTGSVSDVPVALAYGAPVASGFDILTPLEGEK